MLFNSFAFAIFLPIMLLAYWSTSGRTRRLVMLAGSYFFYSWWDWRFTSLLILSTVVDFYCGLAMQRSETDSRKKRLLCISVITNLGILMTFKYFDFFIGSMQSMMSSFGMNASLPVLNVVLPMGISFYTFQTLSYSIDVYRGYKAEKSLLNFAIFVACFPQLVAGPIMRAKDLLPQIVKQNRLADTDFAMGCYRIFVGLFKKMVIAEALSLYVDQVFSTPEIYTGFSIWIAIYAYAFQIYMDFSAYSDIAIGVGLMFGLKLMENFNHPYLADSPRDFWRRWHISLSTWLRDYLYIPLGGSKCGKWKIGRNLMITMALGGLWHGAAWTFVAWGIFHGVLLTLQRLYDNLCKRIHWLGEISLPKPIKVIGMFHLVCIGWLMFRAPSWDVVTTMFSNMMDFSNSPIHGKRVAMIIALCALAHIAKSVTKIPQYYVTLPSFVRGAVAGLAIWIVIVFSPNVKPFIYFQF